jgi:hypothetical protein
LNDVCVLGGEKVPEFCGLPSNMMKWKHLNRFAEESLSYYFLSSAKIMHSSVPQRSLVWYEVLQCKPYKFFYFSFFLSFRKHGCMMSQNFEILNTGVCSLVDNIKMML